MLRLIVLLLLLANAAYFAWSQGCCAPGAWRRRSSPSRSGWRSRSSRRRSACCRREEARRIEAAAAGAGAAPAECLQAGLLDDAQVAGLRQVLETWPAGSWSLEPAVEPARWIVYMGKYPTAEQRRAQEGRAAPARRLLRGARQSRARAGPVAGRLRHARPPPTSSSKRWPQRGVRTARVVQERARSSAASCCKLPAVDDSLRPAAGRTEARPGRQDPAALPLNTSGERHDPEALLRARRLLVRAAHAAGNRRRALRAGDGQAAQGREQQPEYQAINPARPGAGAGRRRRGDHADPGRSSAT